jgi:hypothetical protein
MRVFVPVAFATALLCQSAAGASEPIHGRIQLQDVYAQAGPQSLATALGLRSHNDALGDLRLSWAPRWDAWRFDFAYRIGFDAGDGARYAALSAFLAAPPTTWWDLTDTFIDQSHLTATQRIDRISIGYTSTHVVVRAGRQALTWGAGLVFRPMDLFDPFAPTATDTEYKPGADMLYAQYLFDDGSDLQFVAVPRPTHRGGGPTSNASSFALHFHTTIGALQTTWLLARDHGDMVTAVGVNGSLGGATWNAEIVPTFMNSGGTYVSALLNISDAGALWGRDITYFAEYYRNGFGLDRTRYALSTLPHALLDRLLRGQVFDTGRDYLAAGAQIQWTPLLQIDPTLIANLDDASLYGIAQATYSLSDNLNLILGAQIPMGPANTEFGGIALAPGTPPFLEPPARVYIQLRRYF